MGRSSASIKLFRRRIGRLAPLVLGMVAVLGPLHAQSEVHAARTAPQPAPVEWNQVLDLQTRLRDVRAESTPDGGVFVLESRRGTLRLTPQEFLAHLQEVQEGQRNNGWLYVLLNITSPWGCLWVGLGLFGQVLFTFRMVLQWYASEREKRSVVPVGFWWGSLFGGLMLLVYFIWRKDFVGVLGQSTGVIVYARNLILIYRTAGPSMTMGARVAQAHVQLRVTSNAGSARHSTHGREPGAPPCAVPPVPHRARRRVL